jgi:hypothetical protein
MCSRAAQALHDGAADAAPATRNDYERVIGASGGGSMRGNHHAAGVAPCELCRSVDIET